MTSAEPPAPAITHIGKPGAPRGVAIRPMRAGDAEEVLAIYQAGPDGGDASFETSAPDWATFDAAKLPRHRHVAIDIDFNMVGWDIRSADRVEHQK